MLPALLESLFGSASDQREADPNLLRSDTANGATQIFSRADDNRGVKLHERLKGNPPKSGVARIWHELNVGLEPQICVDVGTNYGEVSLTSRYRWGQTLYLVEANPRLQPALRATIAHHQDRRRIQLIERFAGEEDGEVDFHIDLKWSGTSSAYFMREDGAFKGAGVQDYETIRIRRSRLDRMISAPADAGLLMKIDVEGAEMEVLRGAEGLLRNARWFILLMEFHRGIIRRKGDDSKAWLRTVRGLGKVHVINPHSLALVMEFKTLNAATKSDILVAKVGSHKPAKQLLASLTNSA